MKKFLFLFLCLITNYSISQWRATTPIRIDIKDITFTDRYTGYALGRFGNFVQCPSYFALYKTVDGGESWIKMKTGNEGDAKRALHFVNPMVGWIAEEGSEVLKTTDGGVTWVSQTSGVGTVLNDIWFRDLNNGFLIGNNGMLQRTTNGGSSWTTISSGVSANLSRIYFYSNTRGFIACNNGQILRTTNGGSSWTAINTGATTLRDMWFTSLSVGYAIGSVGSTHYLYTTTNGGTTWTANSIGSYILRKITFSSPQVGYMDTYSNGILKTTDGGATWSSTAPTMNGLYDAAQSMYAMDDNTVFFTGNYGKIFKSSDGGMTWENKNIAFNDNLSSIAAPHKDTVYFGDDDGRMFKTVNGGVSFFQQVEDQAPTISKLLFLNTSVGFMSSINGILMKTIDGGANWVQKLTNSNYHVQDISFATPQIGYACAQNGVVYRTTDIGETWDSIQTGFNYDYLDIFFTSPDTGYVTSSNRIVRTFDGGANWTEYDPGLLGSIRDIVFSSPEVGYCAAQPAVLKTIDAGLTWNIATNISGGAVKEMWMIDDSSGYVTYSTSQRRTIDSCTTLISQSTACNTIAQMYTIDMTDNGTHGYTGGGAGGSADGSLHQLDPAEIIGTQVSTGNMCAGSDIFVGFYGKGFFNTGNTFIAQLSDASGSFASPTTIGTCTDLPGSSIYQSSVITAQIPGGTPAGTGYRIRVIASNPSFIGPDNGFDITIQSGQTPAITLTSNVPGTICPGALLELTTSNVAGGLTPTYQWTVNGNPINNNASNLFIDSLSNGDQVQVTMQSSLGCVSTSNAVSNFFTVVSSASIDMGLTNDTTLCQSGNFQLNANPGLTYAWSPAVGLNDSTVANPIATITQSAVYELTVTNAAGCTDSDSVSIILSNTPEIITSDTSACDNSTLQLESTPGGTYSWTPATGLSSTNISNPLVSISNDITYYLTVSNSDGCTNNDSIQIVVNDLPEILTNDTIVCDGSTLQLNATSGGTYTWTPSVGLSSVSIANPTASLIGDITYYLTITSAEGCVNNDSIQLLTNELPIILINDTTVCVNESIQLDATPGSTYNWSSSASLSDTTIQSPMATINASTTISLNATSAEGCTHNDFINVDVFPIPQIDLISDTSICLGDCITLAPTINTGIQQVSWSTAIGLNDSTILTPTSCATNDITYIVFVSDTNSCQTSDTVNVWVNPVPAVPVITFNGIELSSTVADSYQWFFNGTAIQGANGMTYSPTQNGQYVVEVTNTDGCSAVSDTFDLTTIGLSELKGNTSIHLYPNPVQKSFFLEFESDNWETIHISIVDPKGKELSKQSLVVQNELVKTEISVEGISAGSYLCRVTISGNVHVIPIIVE